MDKVKFILSTIQPMAALHIPIPHEHNWRGDSQTGEHVGSGLRCMFHGRRVVVTALHVIEEAGLFAAGLRSPQAMVRVLYLVQGTIQCDHARHGDLLFADDFLRPPQCRLLAGVES